MREEKKAKRLPPNHHAPHHKTMERLPAARPAPPRSTVPAPRGVTRAVLYYRVSTNSQDAKNQVPELRRYAEFRGWHIVNEYVDQGVSGGKDSRTDLDRMMKEIRAGRYDILLVYSYDRFARSLAHLVMIMDELGRLEVGFKSLQEQIDTTTAQGRMMFAIYAGLAEWQRHVTAEKTKASLQRLKDEGVKLGRPTLPDEVKARIRELHAQGLSLNKIAVQIQWVRASGEYGKRKITNISKSVVWKVLQDRPQNVPPIVAPIIDDRTVAR